MRGRHIAAVALVLGLTVAGFFVTRALAERDARRDSERRVEIAAGPIRGRLDQAASLTQSLRLYMSNAGATGVRSGQFARTALRWLSPADFPAAAWAEQVKAAERTAYERRTDGRIVTPHEPNRRAPPSSFYLPSTLVSGFAPLGLRGVDLRREPGIAAALLRALSPSSVAATPISESRDRPRGLFLVAPATNLIDGVLRPGGVIVFVPEATLQAAAGNPPGLRLVSAGRSTGATVGGNTVRNGFSVAGRDFAVVMPKESVSAPAAALPWIILAAGLVLSILATGLGVNAGRRVKAQAEVDRIFDLSSDLIAVADFDGHFVRVNPAVEQILGYARKEFLARPYLDLVHPDDRQRTAAEAAAIARGRQVPSFENRYRHKDRSYRVLEWTATPVLEERLMYAVARDITARRRAEAEREQLAEEQAALRRVAVLVAEDVPARELFGAVVREVGTLLGADFAGMARFDDNGVLTVATWAADGEHPPVPERWEMQEGDPATTIATTRRATRWTDWSDVPGPIAAFIRGLGIRCTVGTPIVVEGQVWGALALHSKQRVALPPETEARMARFTDLVATAVANADARTEARLLTDEQAALRRVATLVARETSQAETFNAIAEEMLKLIGADFIDMLRYEDGRTAVSVASGGTADEAFAAGSRHELGGHNATSLILRTGQPVRVDNYDRTATGPIAETARPTGIRSVVGAPLIVDDRLWGAVTIGTTGDEPLPLDTEARLGQFTELIATAIGNTEARAEVERLADEQAALRRVATLVAEGASPDTVLDAVAAETERLLLADAVAVGRYESDEAVTVVAHRSPEPQLAPVGTRLNHEGHNVSAIVRLKRKPVRLEDLSQARGGFVDVFRGLGSRALVGTPIVVDGRLWGTIVASWNSEEPPPPDTEVRMSRFAGLLETAIANADTRNQLTASRARLVTAADEARRRLVRDLHDGAQQRLVHTIITLKLAQRAFDDTHDDGRAQSLVGEAVKQAERSNAELRELAHGILPSVLTRGGLLAGVRSVAERIDLPVELEISERRFGPELEASAYFVIAEALTNVMKHSDAESAKVIASANDSSLCIAVQDNGTGGADPNGHGLLGIKDRVTALGGRLEVESPAGRGTMLSATLPLSAV